ncbi:hypothetical protein CRENBAI_017366 [Crenichthys baileyi]|uniref:Uncharacterized protein n=1 Tax=Crenichthys baileyi TaxID=28760 RepID=A0AAV9S5E9_9TELE
MWLYMSQDQQLCVAIEEVVNTFSPALSLDLLLYNVLGSDVPGSFSNTVLFDEPSVVRSHQDHAEKHDSLVRTSGIYTLPFPALGRDQKPHSQSVRKGRGDQPTTSLGAGMRNLVAGMSGTSSVEWPMASAHHRLRSKRSRNAKPTIPHWPCSWTC